MPQANTAHYHKTARDGGPSHLRLATSATAHCLLGCGLGEVVGVILGVALSMSNVSTLVLAVILGFVFGLVLGMIPLLRAGFDFARAVKQVLVVEGVSIAVMETAEVLVEVYTPGVMQTGLSSPLFWFGMLLALTAGFAAAFPVNYVLVGKGVGITTDRALPVSTSQDLVPAYWVCRLVTHSVLAQHPNDDSRWI